MKLFFKVTLLTVFITLTTGYFSFVHRVTGIMIGVLADTVRNVKDKGVNIEYELSAHKFSFIPHVVLKNVRISLQKPNKFTAAEIKSAEVRFNPFHISEVKVDLHDFIKFITFDNEYSATFKDAEFTFTFSTEYKPVKLVSNINDVIITSDIKTLGSTKSFSFSIDGNSSDGYIFEISMNKATMRNDYIDGFYINSFFNRKLNFALDFEHMWQDFRDNGGAISIKKMSFGWEHMHFIGDGSLFFDDKMNLNAMLSTNIFGFDEGLESLSQRRIISKKEQWMAKVVLYSMARNNDKYESYIPAEIIIRNGNIYVGPVLFYSFSRQ